jgi:hypothetical protein
LHYLNSDLQKSGRKILMTTEIAAHIFTILVAIVITFQIALAAGVPWGHLTWGGRFPGQLPKPMRGVAIFSAVLLALFALVVEVRAGVLFPEWQTLSQILVWVVVGYCALAVVLHVITPSRWERVIWLPVVLGCLVCSFVVAMS